jgi:DNA invertase Pin-like site-specific DNA recombinase
MNQAKTVAYLRVSTNDQDLEKNKADILHLANEKDLGKVHWVEEKVSSSLSERSLSTEISPHFSSLSNQN